MLIVFRLVRLGGFIPVILMQFLEVHSYNLQHVEYPHIPDFQVQTITAVQDPDSKIRVIYSSDYTPDVPDYSGDDSSTLDTWSIVWYIASFGGLILFFLIVSCSEWCCRRNARRSCQQSSTQASPQITPDTPPPSYDQFAPPPYEDLWMGGSSRGRRGEKNEYDIYVVPVHALGTIMEGSRREDAPPTYQASAELTTVQSSRIDPSHAAPSIT